MSVIQITYEDEITSEPDDKAALTSILLDGSEGVDTKQETSEDPLTESMNLIIPPRSPDAAIAEWTRDETNYLLKKYNKYILCLGAGKLFRTKKRLWERISQDIKDELKIIRSGEQCENRYKNVLRKHRRKEGQLNTKQKQHNIVGKPCTLCTCTMNTGQNKSEDAKDNKELCEVLWGIFKKKEESRERRHKEKLDVIKSILQNYG